jgi:hypothetical protein
MLNDTVTAVIAMKNWVTWEVDYEWCTGNSDKELVSGLPVYVDQEELRIRPMLNNLVCDSVYLPNVYEKCYRRFKLLYK